MDDENQKKWEAFMNKLVREEVYFRNTYEDSVIKSTPGKNGGIWIKIKGHPAFATDHLNKIYVDGTLEYNECTKKDFDSN